MPMRISSGLSEVDSALADRQATQKRYYDKHAKQSQAPKEGESVRVIKNEANLRKWEPATVLKKRSEPRSYDVELSDGSILRRRTCQDLWYPLSRSCYRYFYESVNWFDALQSCKDNNASLVTISSNVEHDFVNDLCSDSFWIGLNDIKNEGVWRWTIEAEQSTYNAWGQHQPNNYQSVSQGDSYNADCAKCGCGANSRWWDNNCEFDFRSYICEKERYVYTSKKVYGTTGKDACLNSNALAAQTLGRVYVLSKIHCFHFCVRTAGCTAFQVRKMSSLIICDALPSQGEHAQYELEPSDCGIFEFR
ncbi:CD209 antigen-like [Anneissia japonica]|uniref:CD209 antigen-like n=1 Tax=Anneissia japonica TaxID=1529436 RepID=UPI0014258A33|nr:CD209 antigen-like [Anneissia japonica]